jgi:hypothetical protein
MANHTDFILCEGMVDTFISQAGYFMMTIGFAFSLILAFVVIIALLVTACGMHLFSEPGVVVVVTRTEHDGSTSVSVQL